ncbi:MAG TPA: hypothetical protein VF755_26870 [Catenuloplanes sp.]
MSAGEAARELERVVQAVDEAQLLMAGIDQVVASLRLLPGHEGGPDNAVRTQHSALRTRLEHAQRSAARVMEYLRHRAAERGRP